MYVPAGVDGTDLMQRIVEAAAALPSYGAVTGWAGLAWRHGRWFDGLDGHGEPRPVPLAIGGTRSIRPGPGYLTSEERLGPTEIMIVDGLPVTSPERCLAYEMRYARSLRDAVVLADAAFFSDLTSSAAMATFTPTLNGWTGIPQCRDALLLVDENAWSPRESLMRLLWETEGGFPRPRCNVPIFDPDGRLIGVPDLIDPAAGVVGEYDSALHLTSAKRSSDLDRDDKYRSCGLEVVTMVGADARDHVPFLDRLRRAYERASGPSPAWTVEQPPWWVDTTSVAKRMAAKEAGLHSWLWWQAA